MTLSIRNNLHTKDLQGKIKVLNLLGLWMMLQSMNLLILQNGNVLLVIQDLLLQYYLLLLLLFLKWNLYLLTKTLLLIQMMLSLL
jgi:hypothetical protein